MNLLRNLFATKHTGKGSVKTGRSRSANRMSCRESSPAGEQRVPGKGCCGTNCAGPRTGCTASEPRIRTCLCQTNVGCLDRPDCGGFRPRGTAETGACPGPCQCEVEDSWNRNVPPKPNCEWVSNFTELRRQWSDHGRRESCKCCNCRPSRPSTPCRPCLPATPCCSATSLSCTKRPDPCSPPQDPCARNRCEGSRLGGGACQPCCSPSLPGCCPTPPKSCCPTPSCAPPPGCCPFDPCDPPRPFTGSCSPPINYCPPPCSPPPSRQPCAPQPKPILKKRSCCLCAPAGCMCQPMPRNCHCPPPVQIDARADDECTCDCPSAPECACPPSERRFSRSKIRCSNARMCCPLPRLPPGPPCCCIECRPCLPPPCDPCSSSRCCSPTPRFKFCRPASPCPPSSPCRPRSPARSNCRPSPSCSPCRKPVPPSPCRSLAHSSSRGSSCCSPCRAPGQSSSSCDHNGEVKAAGCGDDGERADRITEMRPPQCRCGADGKGCADDCDWCCSQNCAEANDSHDSGPARSDDVAVNQLPDPEPAQPTADRAPVELPVQVTPRDRYNDQKHLPAGNNVQPKPRTAYRGSNASRGSRRTSPPKGRIAAALPGLARGRTNPPTNRTPVVTNALYSRLAVKRVTSPLKPAPRRPGIGPRPTSVVAAARSTRDD